MKMPTETRLAPLPQLALADTALIEHDYADSHSLADELAAAVANDLSDAIATRGRALLGLAGGTTPRQFLLRLGNKRLDWAKVDVTLVDERWVAEDDPRSNTRLLQETLFQGMARAARFTSLYTPLLQPENAEDIIAARIRSLALPYDVIVLGMGADGHVASLFPGGDNLARALDLGSDRLVTAMRAPGASEPRMSLTLSTLLAADSLYLHIEGRTKREVLAQALAPGAHAAQWPVRGLMQRRGEPGRIYWCP
ncbi:6-phosphogluconolactonase [Tahibacter amnicola]|uniref:6-phosphogluconolactonase n=1 Tax=Tahibacter amnicola TaxID=2976241 RepID=A0ABY6BGR5_9GAMM|nr:6-phosphogluconolactonase [Tahibacter amnicola]UXI68972.1 6-phosphogluconolactonase [Tahibacter amnicola]